MSLDEGIDVSAEAEKIACAYCGKLEQKTKLKKKRYCSNNCAKASKTDDNHNSNSDETNSSLKIASSTDSTNNEKSNDEAMPSIETNTPVAKWNVREVCKFIADILGTEEYNEDFTTQEIDGSALILLKEKHLVSAMDMKLGPALKIVAKVQSLLKPDTETAQQSASVSTSNQSSQ